MLAEVICVGDELLLGDVLNTNAQEIGGMLAGIGVRCAMQTTVGDDVEAIASLIDGALTRSDAVIVTGGLGPTQDDLTREAIASVTGSPLVRDPALEESLRALFARWNRPMPPMNLRQADRPTAATPIDALIGTAPGLMIEHRGGVIYAIPGVPVEMREMMTRSVLPDLTRRAGAPAVVLTRVVRIAGVAEAAIAEACTPVWNALRETGIDLAYLPRGGEVRVKLTATASSTEEAIAMLDPHVAAVRELLGSGVVGVDDETLEVVLGRLLIERNWMIGLAESLTGGLVGARITTVPGASRYFAGSIVSYSNEAKVSTLSVDPSLIERDGAVTEAVAAAMARGARSSLRCDVAISLTGVAGPGPEAGIEPGVVCIAVDGPLGSFARTMRLPGERETVRSIAVTAALNLARLYLLEALP